MKSIKPAPAPLTVHEFGTAPEVVPKGYTLEREFKGTPDRAQFRYSGKPVILVKSAEIEGKPGQFVIGVFSFVPVYGEKSEAGIPVENVIYPDGSLGCVSNQADAKKWRIVKDQREGNITYTSRDAAARAELELANARPVEVASLPPLAMEKVSVPLNLYVVTLDWNINDPEEGDYSDKVWAVDEDAAILALAKEMSESNQSSCSTDAERAEFIANVVDTAGTYAAVNVADGILEDCRALIAGPQEALDGQAELDFKVIQAILKKYGAR